ncbi:MAG TPA: SRPBCC domain-containing protein [Polyangiaceae bacterium LLY-WYZ-15_(1-7)]|nr:SRPBCC domain-containing protein [Polyangiaceae bacterium LLY-WYZ-15_(1-7)]HJL06485.1 SRPBCC domain-containing protein [Polyangiaceae bacterium LLY-WYZ-15_(1-7)]HJL12355.1 SRPBCC domain-containing protein [Polyangiaceae bacterium LLY-WYZ-15_(1-7)]HJL24108.1 SRPBCC domain-containing protein [Polyangiaceae bacterium LLY-WYZ-15_(1-7)]HJL29753.1 SRPBCC domain-containing protein [Polyangiaceae bacterium LLY-WYZ-15_(1-7)]
MPTVRTEIEIDASPEVVWQVLTDLGTYADWNPVVMAPRCRGPLGPGADFDFRLKLGFLEAPIEAVIVRADGSELRWEGPRRKLQKPLARGSHYFRLEPIGEGRTRVVHGEEFGGPLFALPWRVLGPRIGRAYDQLNAALKRRAESVEG